MHDIEQLGTCVLAEYVDIPLTKWCKTPTFRWVDLSRHTPTSWGRIYSESSLLRHQWKNFLPWNAIEVRTASACRRTLELPQSRPADRRLRTIVTLWHVSTISCGVELGWPAKIAFVTILVSDRRVNSAPKDVEWPVVADSLPVKPHDR